MSKRLLAGAPAARDRRPGGLRRRRLERHRHRHLQRHLQRPATPAPPRRGRQLRLPGRPVRGSQGERAAAERTDRRRRGHGHGGDHARRHDVHARRRQGALHRQLVRLAGAAELLQRHPLPPPDDLGASPSCSAATRPPPGPAARATPSPTSSTGPRPTRRAPWRWRTAAPTPTARSSSSSTTTRRSPPDYTVFGTVDEATVAAIAQVASQGTDNSNGPGDGAPKQDVEIETVTIG